MSGWVRLSEKVMVGRNSIAGRAQLQEIKETRHASPLSETSEDGSEIATAGEE